MCIIASQNFIALNKYLCCLRLNVQSIYGYLFSKILFYSQRTVFVNWKEFGIDLLDMILL